MEGEKWNEEWKEKWKEEIKKKKKNLRGEGEGFFKKKSEFFFPSGRIRGRSCQAAGGPG